MKTILIVDDQNEVRTLVSVTLRIGDFRILHAESGEEAVRVAERDKPDLIIMDLMMPGAIDGLEATRRIKRNPALKGCFILMLTAKGQQADKDEGFRAGADEYFSKPFSPLELMRKVEKILG